MGFSDFFLKGVDIILQKAQVALHEHEANQRERNPFQSAF